MNTNMKKPREFCKRTNRNLSKQQTVSAIYRHFYIFFVIDQTADSKDKDISYIIMTRKKTITHLDWRAPISAA